MHTCSPSRTKQQRLHVCAPSLHPATAKNRGRFQHIRTDPPDPFVTACAPTGATGDVLMAPVPLAPGEHPRKRGRPMSAVPPAKCPACRKHGKPCGDGCSMWPRRGYTADSSRTSSAAAASSSVISSDEPSVIEDLFGAQTPLHVEPLHVESALLCSGSEKVTPADVPGHALSRAGSATVESAEQTKRQSRARDLDREAPEYGSLRQRA